MKYLSIPAILLMFSAMVSIPTHASGSNSSEQNVSDTAAVQQSTKIMKDRLKPLAIQHHKEISTLGLSAEQLNAIVYVRPDWIRDPAPFSTVQEFAAVLSALPNLGSLKMIKEGEFLGFQVKLAGKPSDGYALYPQENHYLLKGIVDDDGLLEATDTREEELMFQLFLKKAMSVLKANGFKG